MSEESCSGFEPQTYLKDRCKKCCRLKSKHDDVTNANIAAPVPAPVSPTPSNGSNSARERNREKRRSWRDKMTTGPDNSGPEHVNEVTHEDDTTSCTSFKSATSKGMSSAKSMESITSNQDSHSMVTAISDSVMDEDRAVTPTETDSDMAILKGEISRLQEEVIKLKAERENWTQRRQATAKEGEETLVELLEDRLNEAENCIQDYRDENTVLKCELREAQEGTGASKISKKLKATESLCEELMEENESLKADVKDLQQEIEEMQDQYREEEIEEFRELQRELEQNAKNCRILQFKLRKSERLRDQSDAEKMHLEAKVRDLLRASTGDESPSPGGVIKPADPIRVKELESELRIAKEVSVRLHNELESAEDKRYKLEDEVFYLKEKCRELQTQTKWREARNKAEHQAKRISADTTASLGDAHLGKEMRDVLEREADLRDQLKFAEEDLKRTQIRLQDVENESEELMRKLARVSATKRPPMVRSISANNFSEGHAQIQLELAEHEVEHLSTKVDRLEAKNVHLAKKILEMEMDSKKFSRDGAEDAGGNKVSLNISSEMRDVGEMLSKITELERKNMELHVQMKRHSGAYSPIHEDTVHSELRIEKERTKIVEEELTELKQIMLQSDNQRLVALATKVEKLNKQLNLTNERYTALHEKLSAEGDDDIAYVDTLKQRCEELEKQLGEDHANAIHLEVQGVTATSDEIEQCCEVLASVETQTNRICKQIEKIDLAQKDERRRSLSKDSGATIIAELASVISELNNVHQLLEAHKLNNPSFIRKSPMKEAYNKQDVAPCERCKELEADMESHKDEISFYKKKNKDLTNQVLQTEDRWTVEIEKQRQSFELEIKNMTTKLVNSDKCVGEQKQLIESKAVQLTEKLKMIQERDERCERLKVELQKLKKDIQDIEADRKSAREYEIKYKKLESLYEMEREKFSQERTKFKSDMAALKKRTDDTVVDLEKLKGAQSKKEQMWNEEKQRCEAENIALRDQLKKGGKHNETKEPIYATIPIKKMPESKRDSNSVDVVKAMEKIALLEKMTTEQSIELGNVKLRNEDLQSELSKTQQSWTRDKDNLQHKVRTDEKIRNVEFDALQQKFASRMKIMEDTNKSLHSQLVQARRERDYNRESLSTFERKITEEQSRIEKNTKNQTDVKQKCSNMTKQISTLEADVNRVSTDLKLTRDAHEADKALWSIERSHFIKSRDNGQGVMIRSVTGSESGKEEDSEVRQLHANYSKFTESALKAAETVQKQYAEYQKFYTKEVERLNQRVKELSNEMLTKHNESDRTIKELREQIQVLEISQRNLMQARDLQAGAKESLEAEIEKLQENVHQSEVQRLTRKYKLCSVIDQLQTVIEPSYTAQRHELETPDMLKHVLNQMRTIRDEDNASTPENIGGCTPQASTSKHLGERGAPVGSEADSSRHNNTGTGRTYIYNSLPNTTRKWRTQKATITTTSAGIENSSTWEFRRNDTSARATSPVKKIAVYPDPPPNFMLNKEMSVEYDKEGRLHYIPKSLTRSVSYDRQDTVSATGTTECSELTDDEDGMLHSRTHSTGTNILYKIRREELARGGQPSVRMMAQAFDSIEATVPKPQRSKRSIFGIRKSRSVETTETGRNIGAAAKSVLTPAAPSPIAVTVLGRNTSLSQIEELMGSQSPYGATLPRSGRNPFKNMGTKLVERVRRSLSRSSTGRGSTPKVDSEKGSIQTLNGDSSLIEIQSSSEALHSQSTTSQAGQGVAPTPVAAKRTVKKKVKKAATTNLAEIAKKPPTSKTKS